MTPLAFALSFAGFVALCLAMDRHQRDVFGRKLPGSRAEGLRLLGWIALAISLVPCIAAEGWAMGMVLWCGILTAAAGLLVAMVPYAPRLVAPAGGVSLGFAALHLTVIGAGLG